MSEKLHCDVCDAVITTRGGHVDAQPLFGLSDGEKPKDYCLMHYNAYKDVVHRWIRCEKDQLSRELTK